MQYMDMNKQLPSIYNRLGNFCTLDMVVAPLIN
jgi:hypothetical protein